MIYRIFGDDIVGLFTALSLAMRNHQKSQVSLYGGQSPRLKEPKQIHLSQANRGHLQKLIRYYWRADANPHIPSSITRAELETLLRHLWLFAGRAIDPIPETPPSTAKGMRNIFAPAFVPGFMQKRNSNMAIHRSTYHAFSYFVPNTHHAKAPYYADKQADSPLENVTALENNTSGQTQISLHYPSRKLLQDRQQTTLDRVLNRQDLKQSRWLIGEDLRLARLGPYIVLSQDNALIENERCSLESYSIARVYDEVSARYLAGTDILGLTANLDPNPAFSAARLYFRPKRSNFIMDFPNDATPPSNLHKFKADERFASTLAFAIKAVIWGGSLGGIILVLTAAQLFHLPTVTVYFSMMVLLMTLALTLTCLFLLTTDKAETWREQLLGIDNDLELVRLHEFAKAPVSEEASALTSEGQNQDALSAKIESILSGWAEPQIAQAPKSGFWQTAESTNGRPPHTITLLGLPS